MGIDLKKYTTEDADLEDLPKLAMPWRIYGLFTVVCVAIIWLQYQFVYPGLSDPMPVHFDGAGNPDNWVGKTARNFLAVTAISPAIFLVVGLGTSALVMATGNNALTNPYQTRPQRLLGWGVSLITLRHISWFLPVLGIGIQIFIFSMTNDGVLGTSLLAVFLAIMIVAVIVAMARNTAELRSQVLPPEEAAHWRWGMIYNNPDDPRIMVEDGSGINFTFNAGQTGGKILLGVMGLVLIGCLGVPLVVVF